MAIHLLLGAGPVTGLQNITLGQRVNLSLLLTAPEAVVGAQYTVDTVDAAGNAVPIVFDDVKDTVAAINAAGEAWLRFSATAGFPAAGGPFTVKISQITPIPPALTPHVESVDFNVAAAATPAATPPTTPTAPTAPTTTTTNPGGGVTVHVHSPTAVPAATPAATPAAPAPAKVTPWWHQLAFGALALVALALIIGGTMKMTDVLITDNINATFMSVDKALKVEAAHSSDPIQQALAEIAKSLPDGSTVEIEGDYTGATLTDFKFVVKKADGSTQVVPAPNPAAAGTAPAAGGTP